MHIQTWTHPEQKLAAMGKRLSILEGMREEVRQLQEIIGQTCWDFGELPDKYPDPVKTITRDILVGRGNLAWLPIMERLWILEQVVITLLGKNRGGKPWGTIK